MEGDEVLEWELCLHVNQPMRQKKKSHCDCGGVACVHKRAVWSVNPGKAVSPTICSANALLL